MWCWPVGGLGLTGGQVHSVIGQAWSTSNLFSDEGKVTAQTSHTATVPGLWKQTAFHPTCHPGEPEKHQPIKVYPPSFNVPKAPVLSAPPQLNIVFRCIKQRHLQGKAGAIPPRFCSHTSAAQTVSSSNTTAKAWTKHHLHLWNWPSLTWKSTLMWLPH